MSMLLEGQGENSYTPQGPRLWHLHMHIAMLQMILVTTILLAYLFFMFFFSFTPVASENMDVLYDNMGLPDLIKWAGTEAVKQVIGEKT